MNKWLIVATGLVLLATWALITLRRKRIRSELPRGEKEILDSGHIYIRNIFLEIAECFADHGFAFKFVFDNGEYAGRTGKTASGAFIEITHYSGGDYMIHLEQTDLGDATASHDQKARSSIHQQLITTLIYRRGSANSAYFLRQNLLYLKGLGIGQVVASLVRFHQEYDVIWSELEARGVRGRIIETLTLFTDTHARIMASIDAVLDEHQSGPVSKQ